MTEPHEILEWARENILGEQAAHTTTMTKLEEAERDNALLRQDLENAQNQREDDQAEIERLKGELRKKDELVASMRLNGARHYFAFGYDKPSILGSRHAQYCRVCDKERGHPCHFFSDATYLDSRDVEAAMTVLKARLTEFIARSAAVPQEEVQGTVETLLEGLMDVSKEDLP